MYLVAFSVTYLLFKYQVKERTLEIEDDTITGFFFWCIIGLVLGARLFYGLFFEPSGMYWKQPWLIFWPFDPEMRFIGFSGMNYYGGVVGGVIAVVIYARRKKIDLLDWADMVSAGIPAGFTFGRFGNFINGELWGRVTDLPFGMVFPRAERLPTRVAWVREYAERTGVPMPESGWVNLPRHPSQLYEAFFEGILLWLILWFFFRKRRPFKGFLLGLYILGYGVMRFFVDYFRMPISAEDFAVRLSSEPATVFLLQSALNLIPSQLYSLGMIIGGTALLLILYRLSRDNAVLRVPPVPTQDPTEQD
jgi:phosphatidylglycerol---prolipoprotein diacylglyceryl transferase